MPDSPTAVSLAAIALAATAVGGVIWLAKYFAKELSKDLREHTKAAVNQTAASNEVLLFMRNLNGELKKAAARKLE